MDVGAWLRDLGLGRYEPAFRDNEIDAEILPKLTADDLKDLGVTVVGHRRKLLEAIAALPAPREAPMPLPDDVRETPAPRPPAAPPNQAERRQLTVMFVDLVGSTALTGRLDPEDMGAVIRAYQDACAGVITRFEGHIAKYLGDGVLAYFGYPQAHEDAAERAVRAGLGLVEAIRRLAAPDDGTPLAARIGIATGLVVVGELIGRGEAQERAVVGETPNLAARLQALAEPNSVVVGSSTRRLLGGVFEYADLGAHALKGFAEPVPAWRVLGPSGAEGRFEALRAPSLTPLVGREHELGLLLECWERTREGEGQVVFLSGEPGIGKSRLVRRLHERLAEEPHTRLSYYCSPFHQNTTLYPVIGLLERTAGLSRTDPPEQQLEKLEAVLALAAEDVQDVAPLLADLLLIPTDTRYPPLDLTPQRRKERTLQALVDQLAGLAAQRPVLALYEDAHWIDPTTAELLGLVIDRVRRLPVLVVITFRPDFQPLWMGDTRVTTLTLNRLSRRQAGVLVERVTGGKPLPAEVVDQIVAKTDGVPLFVEELTKAVLESGFLKGEGDGYALRGPLPPLAIPTTLQDSLAARLDRLAPAKEVAQIGAAIGREFSYVLLAAVADRPEDQLCAALDQLVSSELIHRRGLPPEATYSFKHALVQDAAYASLLKSRRQQLHARIAQFLEEGFLGDGPELLAHHCAQAGLIEKAVNYWCKAGQQAIARSAMKEAVAHLSAGLGLLHSLPAGATGRALEPDLQLALGGALAAMRGHGMPETGRAYERAVELSRACGRTDLLYPALDGLMICHFSRAELADAARLGQDFLSIAREDDEVAPQIIAHMDLGIVRLSRGELHAAEKHFEHALTLYNPAQHQELKLIYNYDPQVICHGYLAWVLLALGYPDQAVEHTRGSICTARMAGHPLSLGFALARAAAVHQLRWEIETVEALATDLHALATEQAFGTYMVVAAFHRGWVLVQRGQFEEGLRLLHEAIAAFRASKDEDFFPHSLSSIAEASGRAGDVDQALELIAEGLNRVGRNEERWFDAELHRLKGEALLRLPQPEVAGAERCFGRAIAVAQEQEARLWELRATTSLARLWRDQGKCPEARELLAPIYGWFTEGFDTPDLQGAKALLDGLQ